MVRHELPAIVCVTIDAEWLSGKGGEGGKGEEFQSCAGHVLLCQLSVGGRL